MDKILLPQIKNVDKYWFDNNALLTHFMSALSVLFDEGEKSFMASMTAYIKDYPEFKEDIIQFCQEERSHTLWHKELNKLLDDKGKLRQLEKRTGFIIKRYTKFMTKRQKLLVTLCLEALTAMLAEELLKDNKLLCMMRSDAKNVWRQHAIEETSVSHKHLAERLYKSTGGNKLLPKIFMPPVTAALIIIVLKYWKEICENDSERFNTFAYLDAFTTLIGTDGYITKIIPKYLHWFAR